MSEFVEALEKLKALRESGVLTEAEFADQKAKILAQAEPSSTPAIGHDAMDEQMGDRPNNVAPLGGVIGCLIYVILMIILLPIPLILFALYNWNPVEVMLWDNLVLETRTGALVVFSAMFGFFPWLGASFDLLVAKEKVN